MQVGISNLGNNKFRFSVWATVPSKVELIIHAPDKRVVQLNKDQNNYWSADVDNIFPGTLYKYRLDGKNEYPDPASNSQPEGVHGYSEVINHNFNWSESAKKWKGIEKSQMILYELHVGTFTEEGTFKAIIPRLDDLVELGINTIELMPIGAFPGDRNWGYDETYKYAPNISYGTPDDLKTLVDECHKKHISVCLDVVYNHFGPEGNYASMFAPYFTNKYQSPWGQAINFDDKYGEDVANYFTQNALFWFKNYHIDMLRLDSIHNIFDKSNTHILRDIAEVTENFSKKSGKKIFLVVESDLNDSRVLKKWEMGGHALDGQWSDDFYYALRTLLTGEPNEYYLGFNNIEHFKKSMENGYAYSSEPTYNQMRYENSPKGVSANCFIVYSQNHDQIGNRIFGQRLSELVSFDALKIAAASYLLSPYIPMLFMGEEYAEKNPFLYFISHSDKNLIELVREGRKREFNFSDKTKIPDPQSKETFIKSKLNWESRNTANHKIILEWYKILIKLRKTIAALSKLDKESILVYGDEAKNIITIQRWDNDNNSHVYMIINFNNKNIELIPNNLPEDKEFNKILDSSDLKWSGSGDILPKKLTNDSNINISAHSFALYQNSI